MTNSYKNTSETGRNLIKRFESFSPYTYDDGAGYLTIGWGHKILPGESFEEPLSAEQGERLFLKDLREKAEEPVNRLVTINLKQHEFDALASFTFNLGQGNLGDSTLLKLINANKHRQFPKKIQEQFLAWSLAGRPLKFMPGLRKRRIVEAWLFRHNEVLEDAQIQDSFPFEKPTAEKP